MKLRPYQEKAIDDLRASYASGHRAPLFVLPTGGGKGLVFTHMTKLAIAKGNRVLILVHRSELVDQSSRNLFELEIDHGVISPRHVQQYTKPVQVASVQTLVRRLAKVPTPDLIIIDEGHHAIAGTWDKICKHYRSAKMLGVTATPCRTDGAGLIGAFDDMILGPSVAELVDQGYLVKPRVFAPTTIDTTGMRKRYGDFVAGDVEKVVDRPIITGDAIKHYTKHAFGKPAIAFCASVAHAEHVAQQFQMAGIKSLCISGQTPDAERRKAIEDLRDGHLMVLTSCDIISEGTDIPRVECAILLRPTNSTSLYLQQVGRALRTFPGKTEAIILDHVGNAVRHGLPTQDRDWSLEGGDLKKQNAETETVMQCKSCYHVFRPQPACPECGHVNESKERKLEQSDGELVEITEEIRKKRAEVGRARSLDELIKIGKQRGYKPQWAHRIFAARNSSGKQQRAI